MLDFLRRLFNPPASAAQPARLPPPVPSEGSLVQMQTVFPGQAKDAILLFNTALIQMGRDLVGALPAPTPEIVEHVEQMAEAQGEAWSAEARDAKKFGSDARSDTLRAEVDVDYESARQQRDEADNQVRVAQAASDALAPVSRAAVFPAFVLAFIGGLAGAVVINPTVHLVMSGSFQRTVGPDYVTGAVLLASLMLGLVPPLLAMSAALARAHWGKIVALGVLELACIAFLAWARYLLLGSLPPSPSTTQAEIDYLAQDGVARSSLMLAFEALIIVVVTGIGAQVSVLLAQWDTKNQADVNLVAAREQLAARHARCDELQRWRLADQLAMADRDVAAARGEKVRKLAHGLIWQGVMEQCQANADLLNEAPRAAVGERAAAVPN